MDFFLACFELTKNNDWCRNKVLSPSVVVIEKQIEKCPFENKLDCAGFYDKIMNTIYVRKNKNKKAQDAVMLHEVCHWLDANYYSGCGCDPYEVQRKYLLKNGEFILWFAYSDYHHDRKRPCSYE